MHTPWTIDGFQPDLVVTNDEVAAIDEPEAKIAREQRMFEISFVIGTWRQHYCQRLSIALGCVIHQGIAHGRKIMSEMTHALTAEQFGKNLRNNQPVFECITCARRCLCAICNHPPLAIRRAREISGIEMQENSAWEIHAMRVTQETAVAEDQRGG